MDGALPNLIVIGAQKCGSSSLHRYLDLHPEIAMSRPKELNFFLDRGSRGETGTWFRGLDWYRSHFDPAAPVRGESSPNYTSLPRSEAVPARLADVLPDARLIYLVRDPIERAISGHRHAAALGHTDRTLEQALADRSSHFVRRSLYATQLEPFIERFGLDRILLVAAEDLRDRRAETLAGIFAWLGVESGFSHPGFTREWERSAGKDRKYSLAYRASRRLGGERWARLPAGARWRVEQLAYRPLRGAQQPPDLPEALREQLCEWFAPECERLRELTGRSFAGWSV